MIGSRQRKCHPAPFGLGRPPCANESSRSNNTRSLSVNNDAATRFSFMFMSKTLVS